jgi:hypothetical protein
MSANGADPPLYAGSQCRSLGTGLGRPAEIWAMIREPGDLPAERATGDEGKVPGQIAFWSGDFVY